MFAFYYSVNVVIAVAKVKMKLAKLNELYQKFWVVDTMLIFGSALLAFNSEFQQLSRLQKSFLFSSWFDSLAQFFAVR